MQNLFGTPVITLSELLANFHIEQGNSNQNHYIDNLVRAKRVWKELMKDTLYSTRYRVLAVDKTRNTIKMPKDMNRLININIVDNCGNLKPLGFNPEMNTVQFSCPPKHCSCDCCHGANTLCDALDAIQVIEETVTISGSDFIKRTWIKKCGDGTIEKLIQMPQWVPGSEPTTLDIREVLCKLEVDAKSCIKATDKNFAMLKEFCGCYIPSWQMRMCCNDPFPASDYGNWNWEANAREIVHLKNLKADYVVIAYQFNGEECSGDEIMIPEYAIDVMQFGIVYRQKAWSPKFGPSQVEDARINYERAKGRLQRFLRPISFEAFEQLQSVIPKW